MRPEAQSEFTVEDHIQRPGPRFGGEQRQGFALFARFHNGALAEGEEQAALASLEKFGGFVRSGDSDVMWIGPERALVELGKVTHTEREICANRKRPEGSTRTNLGLSLCGFLLESLDIRFGRARIEKKFVEIPLAHEFCLALGQSDVLRELARGKRPQSYYFDAGLFCDQIQHLCRGSLWRCHWNARKASQAHATRGLQVEVILGQEDAASVLCQKRMPESKLSNGGVELQAAARRYRDNRDIGFAQALQKFRKAGQSLVCRTHQIVYSAVNDCRGRTQEQAPGPASRSSTNGKGCDQWEDCSWQTQESWPEHKTSREPIASCLRADSFAAVSCRTWRRQTLQAVPPTLARSDSR